MKWVFVVGGVGLVGYAVGSFLVELSRTGRRPPSERQPWDTE